MFYASFPTCDLVVAKHPVSYTTTGHTHLKFSSGCEFYDVSHFSQAGAYVDPFKDVLSMYFSVPTDAKLTIHYTTVFDVKDSFWTKLGKRIKKLWDGRKGKKDPDKEDAKDQKKDEDIKDSGKDIQFSVSYKLTGVEKFEAENIGKNLVNAYDKFLAE